MSYNTSENNYQKRMLHTVYVCGWQSFAHMGQMRLTATLNQARKKICHIFKFLSSYTISYKNYKTSFSMAF